MLIEKTHNLSLDELKHRIDKLVDGLIQMEIPGGVLVSNISKTWQNNTMDFSFRAVKGFFSSNIYGQISLTNSSIVLEVNVPSFVAALINEENLKSIIGQKMDGLLSNDK